MTTAREYPALSAALPLTFAHRGGAALWPENTLEAFRGALELGVSHLETDLRMTRDGQLVVMHDARVDRTTNGMGEVSGHTLAQLKRLDAGYHFTPDGREFPHRGRGVTIPTLAELVSVAPSARFNVELKERGPFDLPRALAELLARQGLEARFIVAAEQHHLVRDFRRHSDGRVATSASRRECLHFWFASRVRATAVLRLPYQALQIPVRAGNMTLVTPDLLDAAHRRGLAVHVWTIDDPEEMHRLLDLGVDGLMSDHPDRLQRVMNERSQPGKPRRSAPPRAAGQVDNPLR